MEDMEIDQVCIPDTPDRVAVRHRNSRELSFQSNSVDGNLRNLDYMDEKCFDQLRAGNTMRKANRHNGRWRLHPQRNSINVDEFEPQRRSNTFSSSVNYPSRNGPLFRTASAINNLRHESRQSNSAHHVEKGKKSCQQDDPNQIIDLVSPQGSLKDCYEGKNGWISSSNSSSSHTIPVFSRFSASTRKGKEKIDISGSNGFGLANGNVIDLSGSSYDSTRKPVAASSLSDNSPRFTGQKRLVRNGFISPINIASQLRRSAEGDQVGSMHVEKNHLKNSISDGQPQVDIREIVAESNNTYRGKGKEVITISPMSSKDDAKAMHASTRSQVISNKMANQVNDACRQALSGWRATNNHANSSAQPLADLNGRISGQDDVAMSSVSKQLKNRASLRDDGRGIISSGTSAVNHIADQSSSRNFPVIERTSESRVLGNSYPKRQKKRTSRNHHSSSLSVPDDSETMLLDEPHGSTNSRSSTSQRSQHRGVLDIIYEIDESSPEMRNSGSEVMGNTDDSYARARQVEEDEMLARQLQEQLYHEDSIFGATEISEDIAGALEQEDDFFPAVSGQIHRGSSLASSSTIRSSRRVQSQLSQNSSNSRGNQVRAPMTRRSQLGSRIFNRPPATMSRDRSRSSVVARRRNIRFPSGMELEMRLDILEDLDDAAREFSDMSVAMDHILDAGRDFDENDYEMLLALDENNIQCGASRNQVNGLPESVVQTDNFEEACAICLEKPTIGETIRHLPCLHKFHKDCIDSWLSRKKLCPICKSSIS